MKWNYLTPGEIKRMIDGTRVRENNILKAILVAGACVAFAVAVAGAVWYFIRKKEEEEFFADDYCEDYQDDCCDLDTSKDKRIARLEQKIRRHEEKAMYLREQLDAVTAFEDNDLDGDDFAEN